MSDFIKLVYTPAGANDATLAISACRAGGIGVLNGELAADSDGTLDALAQLAANAHAPYGLRLDVLTDATKAAIVEHSRDNLRWLILDAEALDENAEFLARIRSNGTRVLAEVRTPDWSGAALEKSADGIVIKGNEAGGFVGEDSSFILLQKWRQQSSLPMYVHGGMTPHTAAACAAFGVAGGVFDSHFLLMDEVRLAASLRTLIANLSGSETVAVGDGEVGEYFRMLVRPGLEAARRLAADGEGFRYGDLRDRVRGQALWLEPARALLPIGQDVAFAATWRKRYGSVAVALRAVDSAIRDHSETAVRCASISDGAPLARALGTRFPIIQGPMTRVSDTAEFALAVAEGGALPMLAFAVLKGKPLEDLLKQTSTLLGDRPWGIGLLGFAPQDLLDEQLAVAARFSPKYAIIAGGRPDQAVHLEQSGVPTFLHVPSANLIPNFLQEGARRFIFEGRECGGHIGPLSSFVLWSSIVDRLLVELAPNKVRGEELQLVFAGGIHDAFSSAMLQVITAPLAAIGVKVGILMGSAYLFTKEIVASGAIVEPFQKEVLDCEKTVNLESGVGHASRCAYTPFARDFFQQRADLRRTGLPGDERRRVLDELILGRLRTASKGQRRDGSNGPLTSVDAKTQHQEGMYMLGQVATLRHEITSIATLHDETTAGAAALLNEDARHEAAIAAAPATPADIAIIGLGCVLPGAAGADDYWENIVNKVNAITEIPSHRWDWRLYFDADRNVKDRIYSRWGGFLDDLAFDPTRYGMPPKSIEAVDPMQLMGLEIAARTLADAGYSERTFDRERASVIIGASGGIGDVGMQYGLRSELPRFSGSLPPELAAQLPEWTEDSFAGILPNVAAGRIANRLNFGGINLTTDAACASSLAAIYQAVTELTARRSDMVIAGGIDTVQGPFGYLCFSKTQALSPRGRCSTFDVGGDGIVISEGIAMVALKRLADAERDGDRIYAVIKGVGASSDGNAKGLTAPLPTGQLRAMRRAYAMAGFGPSDVQMFEAHGTGTVAGDSAELESTSRLLIEGGASPHQAIIGSVKTIIGHTKATAGAAGLLKSVLALHHGVLPPHGFVSKPIAGLTDESAPLCVLDEALPWLAAAGVPRRAAASAFGFGGTNFHVVLEEYTGEYRDWLVPPATQQRSAELLLWTAKDGASLLAAAETFAAGIANADGLQLRDLAASLAARWGHGGHTLGVVARTLADLRTKLAAAVGHLKGESKALPPGIYVGAAAAPAGKVAVLFSGQGSQYPNMLREAALHFDDVRGALTEADDVLARDFETRFGRGSRLSRFIFPRGAYDDAAKAKSRQALASTDVAQPALGAAEAGLFRLFARLGLTADMYAGHSYGEFMALHAAGVIDYPTLLHISAARGRFIVDAARAGGAELGTMAAVNAPRALVEQSLAGVPGVVLANHNAPLQSVISGTRAGIAAATAKLVAGGAEVTEIPVAAAFHSALVRPAQRELADLISSTTWSTAVRPVYSNSTARPHAADPAAIKRQMAEHLVEPVEFVSEVETMYADDARVFVEIGPKAVLAKLVTRILGDRAHTAIAVDDGGGLAGLLGAVAQLACAGVRLDLSCLYARRDCRVGDPAQPASLARMTTISKHAWMLNGSGARKASVPVRQIGVTLEAVQARQAPATAPAAAAAPPAAGSSPAAVPAAPAVRSEATRPSPRPTAARMARKSHTFALRKERHMDDRRPPSDLTDSSVMSEYFETMRQFLESQERVMAAFLGDGGAPRPQAIARPRALNAPRVAELAAAPIVMPTAKPHVPAPAPVAAKPADAIVASAPAKAANGVNGTNGAAHATAPAPAPTPAAAPPPAAATPPKANGEALTRDKVLDMLLGIVEETTGYPRDMLGLDQNLEADLGIDSIKRVEVVGALLKHLPAAHRDVLTQSRGKLNTQSTLNGIVDLVTQAQTGGAGAGPFDVAGAGETTVAGSRPSRLVMRPKPEPLSPRMGRRLTPGTILVTRDGRGVAEALATRLRSRGADVVLLDTELLATEAGLIEFCDRLDPKTPVAGIVHLAALSAKPVAPGDGPAEWRAQIQLGEKSFFLLLRQLSPRLVQQAHVVAVSAFGGLYGREGSASGEIRLHGGGPGVLKALREERGDLRVKAVDLDLTRSASDLAADILGEVELDGGRQEVGYPAGVRTIFETVAEVAKADPGRETGLKNLVVLATGGARGITAEVLREVARPGNTLVLTGRSRLPESEAAETAALAGTDALRKYFVAQIRAGALKLTPGEVQRRVQGILDLREMRANLADFRAAGAGVEYHSVDVTNEADLRALVDGIRERHGRIDGIVHGAGVIEDKLLVDKASDSWSRVIETKVIGLLLLQKLADPATLKFFTVFSSVAGRYGNSGQSDYATANELMNRICVALQARWTDRVAVSALCWGPWGPTKFGTGMVTAETEAKFEKRGVYLVSAQLGRSLFRNELTRVDHTPVEIICGEGPWEEEETGRGVIHPAAAPEGPDLAPLLADAEVESLPTGAKIVRVDLDPSRHPYLRVSGTAGDAPLSAAAAIEIMAESARRIWPRWVVVEVRDARGLAPVGAECRGVEVHVSPPPYGSSQGFDVSVAIKRRTGAEAAETCFQCVVRLEQALPEAIAAEPVEHAERTLSVAQAYGEILVRDPRLRVIETIHGFSAAGATADARAADAAQWVESGASREVRWVFDPALVDSASQLFALWAHVYLNDPAAPAGIGRIVRYQESTPDRVRLQLSLADTQQPAVRRASVVFLDHQNKPVLAVEDLEIKTTATSHTTRDASRGAESASI